MLKKKLEKYLRIKRDKNGIGKEKPINLLESVENELDENMKKELFKLEKDLNMKIDYNAETEKVVLRRKRKQKKKIC